MELMLSNANIKISAWDGELLVGFLRGFTDYCFDCYVNDLAVDPEYQGKGIGRSLIEELKGLLEEESLIFLISATNAIPFYRKLIFNNFKNIEDTWYFVNKSQ
jgi:ribosomal protein S18 acetylase RimI-like enzyme